MEPTVPDPDLEETPWLYANWIEPTLAEPGSWPIVFAMMGHAAMMLSPLLVMTWRTRHPVTFVLMLGVILISGEVVRFESRIRGGPRGLSIALGLTWLAAIGVAWVAEQTGFL